MLLLAPPVGAGTGPDITKVMAQPASPIPVAVPVTFTATATHPQGAPLSFRWDFGDGTPQTPWTADQSSIGHTYLTAGVYLILVQVRDPGLQVASRVLTLVVHDPVPPLPARHSSTIELAPQQGRVWTANADHNSLSSFGLALGDRRIVSLAGSCRDPRGLTLDGQGRLWIPCRGDDRIAIVDAASETLLTTIPRRWGAAPVAAVASPDGQQVWVAERGTGRVVRYSATSWAETASVEVGPDPAGLAISADGGTLLVTRQISAGDAGIVVQVDATTAAVLGDIELPLDTTSPDSGTAGRGLPGSLGGVAFAPNGTRAFVAAKKDNILRGFYREGNLLNFETTTRALISTLDLGAGQESDREDLDDSSMPLALAVSPLGSHLFVTLHGSRRVVALVIATGSEAAEVDVGLGPDGLVIDPVSRRLYVHSGLDRSVTAFDASAMLDRGETGLSLLTTTSTVAAEVLPAQVYQGKRLFADARDPRISQEGYISCNTCHFEGGRDGQVWDFTQFGEGLRETTSLRGVGRRGQGLYHWSGNFDEIQDFETPIRDHFGGTGLMSNPDYAATIDPLGARKRGRSPDLDALAAYVESLVEVDRSPHREEDGSSTAMGVAGRQVFVDAGCLACHAGPAWTDSSLGIRHDVGTFGPGSGNRLGGPLDGLDTPSLLGVWATPPYLHDGSAATLEEVLTTRNVLDQHGITSTLDPSELEALIAFLRELDGSEPPFPGPGGPLFEDGFDDGTTNAWSGVVPVAMHPGG
jgi:DNA-binding beta-propeller fold protein YncE